MITYKVDRKLETVTFRATLKFESWFLTLQVTKYLYYNNEDKLGEQSFEDVFYWPESKYQEHGYLKQSILDNDFLYQSGKMYEVQYEAIIVERSTKHDMVVEIFNKSEPEKKWSVLSPPLDSGERLDYLGFDWKYYYNCKEGAHEGIPLLIKGNYCGGFISGYPSTFATPETDRWTKVKKWAPAPEVKKEKKRKETELTKRQKELIKQLKEFIIPGGTPEDYEERMANVSAYCIIWNLTAADKYEYSGEDFKQIINHICKIKEEPKKLIPLPFEEGKFYYMKTDRTDIDTRFQIVKIERSPNGTITRVLGHYADAKCFDKNGKEVLFPYDVSRLMPNYK